MTDMTKQDWAKQAKAVKFHKKAFIGGKFVDAASGKTFEVVNPATNKVLTKVAACDKEDVDRAVRAARKAFESGVWSRQAPEARKAVLLRMADLIRKHQTEIALLDTLDMGKPIQLTSAYDIPGSADNWQWFAEAIDKVYDEIAPTGHGNLAMIRREALGVVACVVPWNYPFQMATWKVAPSLAAGNSVILKPAEQSPLSALRMAELAAEAGIPDGVFNVLPGYGETAGKAIGLHMGIDCVGFTGSTEVGKFFLSYSAQSNMKQVWLECGGKSPNLVFADCDDLEAAADASAFGIWGNQGEVCSANSRLLVERKIKDKFIDMLKARAGGFQPGDPLDPTTAMGSIVEERQTEKIMGYIKKGKKVAKLVEGGKQVKMNGSDNYVTPTIFDEVKNDMVIAREEIFGPVLSVIPFESEAEAIHIANDTIYGLAASIWSNNLKRVHRLTDSIQAGTVSVNCVDAGHQSVPFGGFKQSGIGRDLSLHAFDKYTNIKSIWIKY